MIPTVRPPPVVLVLGTDGPAPDRLPLSRLRESGFAIDDQRDEPPETALEIALRVKPAVIVVDVASPNPIGLEVGRRLQAHPETRHIPIIAVTGEPLATQFMITLRVRTCDADRLDAEVKRLLAQAV